MEKHQILFHSSDQLSAKRIFDTFQNRAAKRFGQNFLFDTKINHKIVSSAGDLTDKVVMEVGPGPGGLTLEILKQPVKKLYIVEIDRRWAEVWRTLSGLFDGKLEVIEEDALKFREEKIAPQVIISNLPYNISTVLLTKWLKNFDQFEKLVLMFQKEVAERLYAKPATKSYGRLSVLTQWKSEVEKMFDLESGCFSPPPKVKSTIVRFFPKKTTEDYDFFSALLKDAFLHRRKLLANTLRKYSENIEEILQILGYSKTVRAEEISVEDFRKLILKCKVNN
ncbi:MAG: 16S rRNA (adenine(1518)-N(6)/adenine(1519)-N(6))-dimethyltransferase RsmA [Alphaproteobacteria bacterium]|nr:16S rRNA (adenine(1518)-N(6)/adenine(1519)-N(6))-dimethyltransferase RsmA [Alphaproteobacteria bacterium]